MQLWKAKKRSILERASENTNKAKSSHGTSRPIISYYYYYFRSKPGKLDGLNGFGFDLIVLRVRNGMSDVKLQITLSNFIQN